jgi:succinate dehydrogenase assembly factor 1
LRIPRTKPSPTRPKWELMLRYTFRKNAASVSSPRAISVIEHLLRTGRRQVSMYEDKSVKDCWVSDEMREWDAQQKQKLNPSSQ